jgi:hypothetical protein
MLRTAATIFVFASLALPAVTQSHKRAPETPNSGASVQQAIYNLELTWLDALVRRDQAAVGAILAPEFHDTTMTGQVHDRDQALAAMLNPIRPDLQRSLGRLDVQSYDGRFAVARGVMLLSGANIRRAQVAFTDVFVMKDGKWHAVAAQEALVEQQ